MLGRRLPDVFDCGEPGGGGVTVITGSGGPCRARRCEMYKPTPTTTLKSAMKAGKSSNSSTI